MTKPTQPLLEVFGHPVADESAAAKRYRTHRLCPFNNASPNCTKDKANDPLGVCSIVHDDKPVITCPTRFRQDWQITDDAAAFFFPEASVWSSLTEVRLSDANGKSAGNIDVVLVAYDSHGKVIDFGALEVQGVYISGNVREPFRHYMTNPALHAGMDWSARPNFPRPDYLSSSRKRLAPQLLYKGGILHAWRKKTAVAIHKGFFDTLPSLSRVDPAEADIAWLVYDLQRPEHGDTRYRLVKVDAVYTRFESALLAITNPLPGRMEDFLSLLQEKLDAQLESAPILHAPEVPF